MSGMTWSDVRLAALKQMSAHVYTAPDRGKVRSGQKLTLDKKFVDFVHRMMRAHVLTLFLLFICSRRDFKDQRKHLIPRKQLQRNLGVDDLSYAKSDVEKHQMQVFQSHEKNETKE